jgi:hypothetical protein
MKLVQSLLILLAFGCASRSQGPDKPCRGDHGGAMVAESAQADLDEPALMARIRGEIDTAPAVALAQIEAGERRFGDSSAVEERGALAITALINLNRIGAARSLAYQFLQRYPNGPYSAHVAAMTGVHVTPTGPSERRSNP